MSKVYAEMGKVRRLERQKYETKADHLKYIREKKETEKSEKCPEELDEYRDIKVLKRELIEKIEKEFPLAKTIGKVELDEDEKAILRLPSKFAVRRRLYRLTMQTEIEM